MYAVLSLALDLASISVTTVTKSVVIETNKIHELDFLLLCTCEGGRGIKKIRSEVSDREREHEDVFQAGPHDPTDVKLSLWV